MKAIWLPRKEESESSYQCGLCKPSGRSCFPERSEGDGLLTRVNKAQVVLKSVEVERNLVQVDRHGRHGSGHVWTYHGRWVLNDSLQSHDEVRLAGSLVSLQSIPCKFDLQLLAAPRGPRIS